MFITAVCFIFLIEFSSGAFFVLFFLLWLLINPYVFNLILLIYFINFILFAIT